MSTQRFPLAWPTGWPRTAAAARVRAAFGKSKQESYQDRLPDGSPTTKTRARKTALTVSDAARRLEGELDRLGATEALLSTNQKLRIDGTPRSDLSDPADVGAAVYFELKGKPLCLACDRWTRLADNIAALAQHIDALRRIERYGVGRLQQAFAGYALLPASPSDWWIVLDVGRDATIAQIEDAYRRLARQAHPDAGGSHNDMARLNAARDAARAEGR
jgi:hypothetical protein